MQVEVVIGNIVKQPGVEAVVDTQTCGSFTSQGTKNAPP